MKQQYKAGRSKGTVSLVIAINDTPYKVGFGEDVNVVYLRRLHQNDYENVQYAVTDNTCTCLAFSNFYGPCKHILAVHKARELLGLELIDI